MKKRILLLMVTFCTFSPAISAESARSNDVLHIIPGAQNHETVMASATPASTTVITTKKKVKHRTVTTRKHRKHTHYKKN